MKRYVELAGVALLAFALGTVVGLKARRHDAARELGSMEATRLAGDLNTHRVMLELIGRDDADCARGLLEITLRSDLKVAPDILSKYPVYEPAAKYLRESMANTEKALEINAALPKHECGK